MALLTTRGLVSVVRTLVPYLLGLGINTLISSLEPSHPVLSLRRSKTSLTLTSKSIFQA
jgi:hypothetical protein